MKEIFVNNVRIEKEKNLCTPGQLRSDPIAAFLGRSSVTHSYTGEQEDVFDYVYRHTLQRPRDLMTLGQRLSDLPPEERRNEARLKVSVNQGATEIAEEYLNEISPYIGDVDLVRLFSMLRSHILSADEVEHVREQYDAVTAAAGGTDGHVLSLLYKAGLLGCVHHDLVSGVRVQRFLRPGDESLDRATELPPSSHYLVHPILAEVVAKHSREYPRNIDPVNVVGNGRPWRERGDSGRGNDRALSVLKADVKEFSRFMEAPDIGRTVSDALRAAVAAHAAQCLWHEVVEGDAVIIVHDEPNALINVALRLSEDLFDAPGHPQLRIALDHGPVRLDTTIDGHPIMVGGEPLRRAARIEPHVTAGEIWATEEFRRALESQPTRYQATHVRPHDGEGDPGEAINVKKPGSAEPDIWLRLYRIEPRRHDD